MRVLVLAGLGLLSGCSGGGTAGTNYSDPPPMAEIIATPSPKARPTPEAAETSTIANIVEDNASAANTEAPANAM